jgi:imidazolonepropionase-like amidohydrolase
MSAEDVRQTVREYIATSGIDFVKYASSAHGEKKFIALSPDAQAAIVEEAHAAGMTAQACATTPEALKLAIEAGVDLLQHGTSTGRRLMPRETLELIAARQLPCVASFYSPRYIAAFSEKVRHGELDHEGERLAVRVHNARELIRLGAKLMLAIDGGVFGPTVTSSRLMGTLVSGFPDMPYRLGSAHLYWLKGAVECGMAPMDALLAATRNVAEAYRRDDELGTIEPGKRADLLVLDGDPLADVESYGRIRHVVKGGELVDRGRLPEHPVLTRDEGGRVDDAAANGNLMARAAIAPAAWS